MKKLNLLLSGVLPCLIGFSQPITTNVVCDECSDKKFILQAPSPQIFASSSAITYNQPITIVTTPPRIIKNIQADLVYFEMIPDDDLCLPCNKDDRLYGHFLNATNNQQWDGPQNSLNITILTPATPCCGTKFRWCIRYRVAFSDCSVCTKLVCYELRKEGCLPDRVITDSNKRNNQSN